MPAGVPVIYNDYEISCIREAARIAAVTRNELAAAVYDGITTYELDRTAYKIITRLGAESAFYGYNNFPGTVCISLNNQVVHGIPSKKQFITEGDIVSIDLGVRYKGFYSDTAETFILGTPENESDIKLVEYTEKALYEGINATIAGNYVKDISLAVEKVAKSAKLSVVREFVGHGCGKSLHEPPEIPNIAKQERGAQLKPGMVLCIEPAFNSGSHRVFTDSDGWTVKTEDGSNSAHFEHMVLVTETDPEILSWQKM